MNPTGAKIYPTDEMDLFSTTSVDDDKGEFLEEEDKTCFDAIIENIGSLLTSVNQARVSLQKRVFKVISYVFSPVTWVARRIFTKKTLNPSHANFIEHIQRCDAFLPKLKEAIDGLTNRFNSPLSCFQDLQRLQSLHYQIKESQEQIDYFLKHITLFTPSVTIKEDLVNLAAQYKAAGEAFQTAISENKLKILNVFNNIYNGFMPLEIAMPDLLLKEFKQHADIILEIVLGDADKAEKTSLSQKISNLKNMAEKANITSLDVVQRPLPLENIGNSCYIDSVLQVLFAIPGVREKLHQELKEEEIEASTLSPERLLILRNEAKAQLKQRKQIQAALIQLVDGAPKDKSYLQYFLRVMQKNKPLEAVRHSIFQSDLNKAEFPMHRIYDQLDAASILELIMHYILNENFLSQRVVSTSEIPGRIFYSKPDSCYTLQIEMDKEGETLQDLVNTAYAPRSEESGGRRFIPKDGVITGDAENPDLPLDKPLVPKKLNMLYHLKSLPDVMGIQLKRFGYEGGAHKIDKDVALPEDGIIDFGEFYAPDSDNPDSDDAQISAKYEITGYVVHEGRSLDGGHYTACVKIGDKFYNCNDINHLSGKNPYEEIKPGVFYGEEQPYIIMLKRIKEEDEV